MTPKERAVELKNRFTIGKYDINDGWYDDDSDSVQNAIIVVEEIIKHNLSLDKYIGSNQDGTSKLVSDFNYWDEVLFELKQMQ